MYRTVVYFIFYHDGQVIVGIGQKESCIGGHMEVKVHRLTPPSDPTLTWENNYKFNMAASYVHHFEFMMNIIILIIHNFVHILYGQNTTIKNL